MAGMVQLGNTARYQVTRHLIHHLNHSGCAG